MPVHPAMHILKIPRLKESFDDAELAPMDGI